MNPVGWRYMLKRNLPAVYSQAFRRFVGKCAATTTLGLAYYGLHSQTIFLDNLQDPTSGIKEFDSHKRQKWTNTEQATGDQAKPIYLYEQSHSGRLNVRSGIRRYDTAQLCSTTNGAERAHAEAVLPVPTGLWSFFGTFDCRFTGQHEAGPNWFRRQNLIMAVTGALADLYHDTWNAAGSLPSEYPIPSSADIRRTLQETFWRLDADTTLHAQAAITAAATMTSGDPPPTSNQAQLPDTNSTILAFYDGPTHRLHLASTGKTCAVIRHNTGRDVKLLAHGAHLPQVSVASQSAQWYDDGGKHHPLNDSAKADANGHNRSADHGFQDQTRGKIAPLRSSFQTVYPMVTSVDIHPGDVVILASGNIWEHHNHAAIADALGPFLREQHVKRANPAQQGDHPRLNYNTEVLEEVQVGLTNQSVVSPNSTSNPRDGGNAAKRLIEKISEMGTLEKYDSISVTVIFFDD